MSVTELPDMVGIKRANLSIREGDPELRRSKSGACENGRNPLQIRIRRGARVVESGGLENR